MRQHRVSFKGARALLPADTVDVFVSYSRKDKDAAVALKQWLERHEISVWLDVHGIEHAEVLSQQRSPVGQWWRWRVTVSRS